MQKTKLECFYSISKFEKHEQVKDNLLKLIAKADYTSPKFPNSEVDISRCDWHNATDYNREWFLYLKDNLFTSVLKQYNNLGYDGFTLQEIWFQQYYKDSEHGWHTHSSNLTNVYYLELPENSSKTLIVSPYDQETVIEVNVQEGDILCFPSFVLHKGPKNQSSKNKTIISYNTNLTYSDNIYGRNLGDF